MKVLCITNIPSPYKVALMNELGKKVELTCCFERQEEENREKEWYRHDYSNFTPLFLKHRISELFELSKGEYDVLINSDYTQLECMILTLLFRLRNKPVILQADGGIPVDRGFVMNSIISLVMKLCSFYLSSGEQTNQYFEYYGIKRERIFNYRFSSLTTSDIAQNKEMSKKKEEYKKELGMTEEKILLSVGQQIPRKGFDILIQSMKDVPMNVGVYIVGGKPDPSNLELISKLQLKNVHFVDFMDSNSLKKYYAASDLFVFPTREDIWGLVINEAMSFGLPIISTNKCVAAVEFVNQYNNGIIVEVESIEGLSKAICTILNDEKLYQKYTLNSLNGIQEYTIENTALDYERAIQHAKSLKRKRIHSN